MWCFHNQKVLNQFYLTTHNSKEIERKFFLQGEIQLKKGLLSGFCVTMFHMHVFFLQYRKSKKHLLKSVLILWPILYCMKLAQDQCQNIAIV